MTDAPRLTEGDPRDGSFVIGGMAVTRQDYLAFTDAIGFGDDRTEPAARPEQLLDPIEQAFHEADEHRECPVLCEDCGDTLAGTICPDCHGSGCSPLTALGAYDPCPLCAGATKVHEGCVGRSYADLAALLADRAGREGAHQSHCQRFPTGWLCVPECTTVWHDDPAPDDLREKGRALADEWEDWAGQHLFNIDSEHRSVAKMTMVHVHALRALLDGEG